MDSLKLAELLVEAEGNLAYWREKYATAWGAANEEASKVEMWRAKIRTIRELMGITKEV